jgi:pyruvate/2-oxoglutarate dehydrogenase complex dihydrolipoamide dehydrogenase (E3) component
MPSNETYNLVVIGAGTAGLAAAIGAAELGARVALIEREATPSPRLTVQSLARTAHEIAHSRKTTRRYFNSHDLDLDFSRVLAKLRARPEAESVSPLELARAKGIECSIGQARFLDQTTLEVEGRPLKFARALIATGSSVLKPGSATAGNVVTSDELLGIEALPVKLAVIGSNADAVAIAQSFARLGSAVTLTDNADRLLASHESRAAKLVTESLLRDGVKIELASEAITHSDVSKSECVIFCSPRVPNVHLLNLDAAKVALELDGRLCANEKFQTTNPHVYACGGVISKEPSPHESEAQARCVIGNALFLASHLQSELISPRIVSTDPEIATVGFTPEDTASESLEEVVIDHPNQGYLRIVHNRKGDILGATIVASRASELIGEIVLAINHQIKLGSLGSDIHPHGTLSEFIKQCGDLHHRKLLTPKLAKSLSRFLRWRR